MKQILIILNLCWITVFSNAQGFDNSLNRFSNTTDYINVNRDNFVVTNAGSDLDNYHHSTVRLGIELAKIASLPSGDLTFNTGSTPHNVLGKFTAYRVEYTEPIRFLDNTATEFAQTKLRCLVVRANSNIDLDAPCIMIATGVGGRIEDFGSGLMVNYTDLLMRGYVVMFYETLGSGRPITLIGGISIAACGSISNTSNGAALGNSDPNLIINQMYLNGEAAAKLLSVPTNSAFVKIDPNKIFMMGFSIGAIFSTVTSYAKRSDFPVSYNQLSGIWPRDNYTINDTDTRNATFSIRGAVVNGFTYFTSAPGMVDIFDAADANKRGLYIFGKNDIASYPYLGGTVNSGETTIGHLELSNNLTNVGIKHFMSPICDASHTLYTNPDITGAVLETQIFETYITAIFNTPPANVVDVTTTNTAYLQEYNSFKKINTQIFQVGNTAAKFFQNTLNNATTVMDTPNVIEHIKSNSIINSTLTYYTPFLNDTDWQFNNINSDCTPILSIDDTELNNKNVKVVPNPNNGQFKLDFDTEFSGTVSIYNTQGSLVQTQIVYNTLQLELAIASETSGLYWVKLQHANDNPKILKIILGIR